MRQEAAQDKERRKEEEQSRKKRGRRQGEYDAQLRGPSRKRTDEAGQSVFQSCPRTC